MGAGGGGRGKEMLLRLETWMLQSKKQVAGRGRRRRKCNAGLEMIAWEKVKTCCSVGLRETSCWEKRESGKSETLRDEILH